MEQNQIANTNDFKEFHSYAKDLILSERVNIPSSFITQVQKLAIKKLGLENINQIRDRYEGQAFMDKLMLMYTGIYILEKSLDITILEYPFVPDNKNDFSSITYKDVKYKIVPFYFGQLPIIALGLEEPLIFCAIRSDFKNGSLYGVLNQYNFNDKQLFVLKSTSSISKTYKFIGFKNLERFI
jgi:hypothetical protein